MFMMNQALMMGFFASSLMVSTFSCEIGFSASKVCSSCFHFLLLCFILSTTLIA